MRRLAFLLGVALLSVIPAHTEVKYQAVSATSTSQTRYFPAPVSSFLLCNYGANEIYYRIFDENDTPAAATTSYATLVAGTATAPICKSFTRTATMPAYYKAIAIICDTAETATVQIESQ